MAMSGDLTRLLLTRAAEDEAAARALLPVTNVTDSMAPSTLSKPWRRR